MACRDTGARVIHAGTTIRGCRIPTTAGPVSRATKTWAPLTVAVLQVRFREDRCNALAVSPTDKRNDAASHDRVRSGSKALQALRSPVCPPIQKAGDSTGE